jgi:mannose-1-phosphate guanylyltransferase/mannose-6-phosphate isomerase
MIVIPVILSGGSGTRLWPLSRKHYPKQLLRLTDSRYTLLQQTALRVAHLAAPIVVCNADHRFMVAEQLSEINHRPTTIMLEPVGRNTAPAIALAAIAAQQQDPEAIIAVFPADHVINDQDAFTQALEQAVTAAKADKLVTFGIIPTRAETGYGYIKASQSTAKRAKAATVTRTVDGFVEKPNLETAQVYLASGDHYWNSGMFVFKASVYLDSLAKFNPEIVDYSRQALAKANSDLDFIRVDKAAFALCPDDSIDYALMERADNVVMVPLDAQWSDIGSWHSLWEITDKDAQNNAFIGDVIAINCHNTLVRREGKRDAEGADKGVYKLVAAIGLDNIVIIDTKDALLVAHQDQVQQVKAVVEQLKAQQRDEHLNHREVHRPWGSYEAIDDGNRYKVKRIKVKPGACLSLQMHHHRAEHWVVVKGTAVVQIGEQQQLLTEDQSVYIPIGEKHRLSNPGKVPLELIEVQSGSYLGEDDIVRFEDLYQRQ